MKKISKYSVACALLLSGAIAAANAEVAVIAGSSSSVSGLTQRDIKDIFLGKTDSLPNGTPVEAVDLVEGNPTRDEFYQKAMNKTSNQVKSYWAKRVFTGKGAPLNSMASDAAVKQWVAGGAGRIGYIDAAAVDSSVKVLFRIK